MLFDCDGHKILSLSNISKSYTCICTKIDFVVSTFIHETKLSGHRRNSWKLKERAVLW